MVDSPWKQESCYILSWEMLGVCLDELRQHISNDLLVPTIVVGIARGGLIPATFFANTINGARFVAMSISRNRTNEVYSAKKVPELTWMSPELRFEGERVLLVDDVTSSGETLRFACDLLAERGADKIWTAVVARMERSAFVPDYTAVTLDDWIIFPWEILNSSRRVIFIGRKHILKAVRAAGGSDSVSLHRDKDTSGD